MKNVKCIDLALTLLSLILTGLFIGTVWAYAIHYENNSNLCLLLGIFRHGSKVPSTLFLNPNQMLRWNDAYGQLTNEGKWQIYSMGKRIRRRYGDFIDPNYDPRKCLISSTQMDRTLMTAQAFAAGLFPPIGDRIWNKDLDWQPIPVYVVEVAANCKFPNMPSCVTSIEAKLKEVFKSPNNILTPKHKETLNKILEAAPSLSLQEPMKIVMAIDDLSTMMYFKEKLPNPLIDSIDDINQLKRAIFAELFDGNQNTGKTILEPVLQDIISRLEGYQSGNSTYNSIFYAMHDANVMSAMKALTDFNGFSPSFGANIFLEIRGDDNKCQNMKVELFYSETAQGNQKKWAIKGGDENGAMSLVDFQNLLQEVVNRT